MRQSRTSDAPPYSLGSRFHVALFAYSMALSVLLGVEIETIVLQKAGLYAGDLLRDGALVSSLNPNCTAYTATDHCVGLWGCMKTICSVSGGFGPAHTTIRLLSDSDCEERTDQGSPLGAAITAEPMFQGAIWLGGLSAAFHMFALCVFLFLVPFTRNCAYRSTFACGKRCASTPWILFLADFLAMKLMLLVSFLVALRVPEPEQVPETPPVLGNDWVRGTFFVIVCAEALYFIAEVGKEVVRARNRLRASVSRLRPYGNYTVQASERTGDALDVMNTDT